MSINERVINFGAGPAQLPLLVLAQIREDVTHYGTSGMGIFEINHRSKQFAAICEECEAQIRSLMQISNDYAVIFTTGGATQQFSMVPLNLLEKNGSADYILTDHWSEQALAEAQKVGTTRVAGSSKDFGYTTIPGSFSFDEKASYCHFTSNNTIFGTRFAREPDCKAALVCDASSDLMSHPIDIDKYGVIYAGAQKNLGVAGVCLVIIRKDLVERAPNSLPVLMQYRTYINSKSLYNTPPVFAIYALNLMVKWIAQKGGLAAAEASNLQKAKLLYQYLDQSNLFSGIANYSCRSLMNVTFRVKLNQAHELEKRFLQEAAQAGMVGLQGHRLLGGLRASLYNAISLGDVAKLITFMGDFEQRALA